jgi:acyl-CoA synthetase (AMP-forming)/AMP-acid ligase II
MTEQNEFHVVLPAVDGNHDAMKWCHQAVNQEYSDNHGYWILPQICNIKSIDCQSNDETIRSLSYNQLQVDFLEPLMSALTKLIQEKSISPPIRNFSSTPSQPIIVICIPEGPYLPMAVLSIHLLNVFQEAKDKLAYYSCPIILPLDPNEGEDRILHMIEDAKPTFVLYVKDTMDGKKIKKILASMNDKISLSAASGNMHQCHTPPTLVDIATLLDHGDEPNVNQDTTYNGIKTTTTQNRISHIVYTSGTTGVPKGTISSIKALNHYIGAKNKSHGISSKSNIFLASSLSFDPCLSDIIATFYARGCLSFCKKEDVKMKLGHVIQVLCVSHILCTPSLWNVVDMHQSKNDSVKTTKEDDNNGSFQSLEVVALGGEVMSGRIKGYWSRKKQHKTLPVENPNSDKHINEYHQVRLLATYGVTEACVYQTVGEIIKDEGGEDTQKLQGHFIGSAMDGIEIRICKESNNNHETQSTVHHFEIAAPAEIGEIVISGNQLDEFSGYLNLSQLTKRKFIKVSEPSNNGSTKYYYKTGDRGLMNPNTGQFQILGRIDGEEGMVKINGVRVELGEIEHSIVDSEMFSLSSHYQSLVVGCIVILSNHNIDEERKLIAYCVLDDECLQQLGMDEQRIKEFKASDEGLICTPSPLLVLLRARCERSVRKECTPSIFVLIPCIPLTRTGKRNRKVLPKVKDCHSIDLFINGGLYNISSVRLDKCGRCGRYLYDILIDCLNLQQSQLDIVTTRANFAMLGGDSLSATLVVRSLYALHHQINNSRDLGGAYGYFDGPFNVSNLLRSKTLGDYATYLDANGIFLTLEDENQYNLDETVKDSRKRLETGHSIDDLLYNSLFEAITLGQTAVSIGLIYVGTNPNHGEHGFRLGKLKNGRKQQKEVLKSNPLHLACAKGNYVLVAALLQCGCNCKSPDASGQYPLHLACSGYVINDTLNILEIEKEDKNRKECVKLLIEYGKVPLAMKNAAKQTVLHCSARSGYVHLLTFLIDLWEKDDRIKPNKLWGPSKFDWQDRWFRTPIHWAVLNGKLLALKILLNHCSATPLLPRKSKNRSSVAIESPIQICERLYDTESEKGAKMKMFLLEKTETDI